MKPHSPQNKDQSEVFRSRLDSQINMNHELVRLSSLIDWNVFDERFGPLYHADKGCPGKPTRLMVGLLYLKHIHKLSDEQLVHGWLGRNHLKGTEGDGVNVLLSCAGHNLQLILKRLRGQCARIFCRAIIDWIIRVKQALWGLNDGIVALSAS